MKNYMALSNDDKRVVEAVEVVFTEAETLEEISHSNSIDSIFTIFDNILNYPYEDDHRILNLELYQDEKILHLSSTQKLFEIIGFEYGSTESILVFPHDRDMTKLLLALETLITKISLKIEVNLCC